MGEGRRDGDGAILSAMKPSVLGPTVNETDLPDEAFPPACPFSLEQILDAEFFPD